MGEEQILKKLATLAEGECAQVAGEIADEYRKLHQRMNKISRISDGYQEQLRDLNRKLQEANQNLSQALAEVKTLRGLIPICARCKRIRDDDGLWDQIETYISQHSEAVFSHGVCPECAKALFPNAHRTFPKQPRTTETEPDSVGPEEQAVQQRLEILSQDEALRGHPLMGELESLAGKHVRLARRLLKISRISDGYQRELKDANEALKESSRTDYLTGLANRRDMMDRLKAEQSRAKRGRLPLTLLMVDVDHFKTVNDAYGHEAGDRLLQAVAGTLRATLREYDVCSRWGGEEFLILLPETNAEDGAIVGGKLRDHVTRIEVDHEGYCISATISLGLACYHRGESLTSLLQRADEAMYEAKRLGRNRLATAPEPEGLAAK
jgi:diguanylate cyclase (GGDEF)-like protein